MSLVVGKLVGKQTGGRWSQVHDFFPDDEEKRSRKGRLLAVVGLQTEEEAGQVELVATGREVLSRLHELYYGSGESAMEGLKNTVEMLMSEFSGVEVGCAVWVEGVVYVATGGRVGVWVGVEGKKGWLVRPEEAGRQSFSGKVRDGLVMVLGNGEFWQGLPEGTLATAASISGEDMEQAMEMLAAVERGGGRAGEVGVMLRWTGKLTETAKTETDEAEVVETQEEVVKKPPMGGHLWEGLRSKIRSRVYVNYGDRKEQKRKTMWVGVGFLILVFVLTGLGQLVKKNKDNSQSAASQRMEKLSQDFSEARELLEINPTRSKQILEAIKASGSELPVSEQEWNTVWLKAMGIVEATPIELVDLTLVREKVSGTKITLIDGKIMALDVSEGRVLEVDTKTGNAKVVAGGQAVKEAKLLASYVSKTLVWGSGGVVEVGGGAAKIGFDEEWGEITDMEIFGGNVYLLDKGSGEIWRYAAKAGGYGEKQKWLASSEDREGLKMAESMTIDGSIWALSGDRLLRYTRGVVDPVEVSGLDVKWAAGAAIFSGDEVEQLYVLDPAGKRVIVLNKQGEYLKQYTAVQLEKSVDLVVDETAKKIYTIDGQRVWSIDL